jgi:hypothetical protein
MKIDVKESSYDPGNFEAVKEFVNDDILDQGKAVSLKVLHEIYGLPKDDCRYRNPNAKTVEIVIPSDCLDGRFINYCPTKSIQATANYLRDEILNKYKDLPEVT